MKKLSILLIFLAFFQIASAQKFTDVFTGKAVNSVTTYPPQEFNLTTTGGANLFDTLRLYLQAGSESAFDSVRCSVYVRVKVMGRWSQGLFIDSLNAPGSATLKFDTLFTSAYGGSPRIMLTDSLQSSWFSGTSISGIPKNLLMNRSDWTYQVYIVGLAPAYATIHGNSIGTLRATQITW